MKVALGSDHAGFRLKELLKPVMDRLQVEYEDLGCFDEKSVDYPDFSRKVAEAVAAGQVDRGVLICGTGLGMCITANKVPGVRAVTVQDEFTARMSREHNDANVLTMGERVVGAGLAEAILTTWLTTEFAGGRHVGRVDKMKAIEAEYARELRSRG